MTDTPENQKPTIDRARAVAIGGSRDERGPQITATGRGKFAERILDIAFDSGVKVRQDQELVNILDAYDVDSPVPLEALNAVSEILRYVYAENARMEGVSPGSDVETAEESGPTDEPEEQ